jgi:two-component system OmpR family response regulator
VSSKILIADDEQKIAKMISQYLETSGYTTIVAFDGLQAIDLFKSKNPDCLILDVAMPGADGLEVAREVRKVSSVPIIFLSAKADEVDRIVGLEIGADDYVIKPFSLRELLARIRAVLRRASPQVQEGEPAILTRGALEVDLKRREVLLNGHHVPLTTVQIDILAFLMREPGRVFTRMEILEGCLGSSYQGYERTIDAHIKNIRKALGDDMESPRFIGTVRGIGYKFLEQPE